MDPARLSSAVDQKIGEPFSQQSVEQAAAAIKSAGKYEEVRIRVDPESNGARIRFVLEPAVYIGIFQFPGAEQFPDWRVIQVANYPVQAPFNAEVASENGPNYTLRLTQRAELAFSGFHGVAIGSRR